MKKQSNKRNISSTNLNIFYLPIYLIVGVIPHLYYYMKYSFTKTEKSLFFNAVPADLYILIKARALLFLTIVGVAFFIYAVGTKKIKLRFDVFSKLTIATSFIIILAAFFSKYQDLAYFGGRERFEGLFVYLSYIAIMFISKVYSENKEFIKGVINSLLYSSFLMSVFGLLQTFDYDIYTASPLRWIIFPREIAANISTMVKVDIDYGAVASLYHSNYFGVFMVMGALAAILNILGNVDINKNLIFSIFLMFGIIASSSEASMLAFAITISAMFYFKFDDIKNKYKYFIIIFISFALEVLFISNFYRLELSKQKYFYGLLIVGSLAGAILSKLKDKYSGNKKYNIVIITLIFLMLFSIPIVGISALKSESPIIKIEKFDINDNILNFKTEDMRSDLIMTFLPDIFKTNTDENARAEIDYNKQIITVIRDDKSLNFVMEYYDSDKYFVKFLEYNIVLKYENGKLYYADYEGNTVENNDIKKIDFLADNGFQFSARGYIWSRFIPLTFDSPILGYGPDAYPYIFPQTDYVEKYNLYGNGKMIVDKPHSLYLDWILDFGYLGFIAFVGLISMSLYNGMNKFRKYDIYGILLILAVLSSGLFNDSIIGISQIFFAFLGVTAGNYVEKVEG